MSFLGCQSDVLVKDESGRPISHAIITPISASINYQKVLTDDNGKANIGSKFQKVEWIDVEKEGYKGVKGISYNSKKPIVVVLKISNGRDELEK